MIDDFERCYRFMQSRDPRYDGFFVVAVKSTGVYCRPSCPARLPYRRNVRLFRSVAAAQEEGFRACKRCDPDAVPGSPHWNRRAGVAGRAMRLIADGAVDREGVGGLAGRLHFSERQLNRILVAELGAGPVALARAQRAQSARHLIESTELPFAEVAVGAGFGSVRQFNDTLRAVYGRTPTELRTRARRRRHAAAPGSIELRLPVREPFDGGSLVAFLAQRAVPGVEEVAGGTYRRTLRLHRGSAVAALTPDGGALRCELHLDDLRDLTRRSPGAGACSTWMPIPSRSRHTWARTRCSGRWCESTAGCGCPARWTASRSRCGRSWDSRYRWRARARSSGGLRRNTGRRSRMAMASPGSSRPRTRWPRPIPSRCRCRAAVLEP